MTHNKKIITIKGIDPFAIRATGELGLFSELGGLTKNDLIQLRNQINTIVALGEKAEG